MSFWTPRQLHKCHIRDGLIFESNLRRSNQFQLYENIKQMKDAYCIVDFSMCFINCEDEKQYYPFIQTSCLHHPDSWHSWHVGALCRTNIVTGISSNLLFFFGSIISSFKSFYQILPCSVLCLLKTNKYVVHDNIYNDNLI